MDTTEHDVVKSEGPEPSEDGKNEVGFAEDLPSFSREQLFSIAAASLLVLAVVWVSFKWGYHPEKGKHVELSMPVSVYAPLLGVIFFGTVASFWAEMRKMLYDIFGNEPRGNEPPRQFKPLPDLLLEFLVYALTGVVVFALIRLVSLTGGFTDSPFTPLMTAPASVGVFMAFSKYTTVALTVVGIVSVWLSSEALNHSSPHLVVKPDSLEQTSHHTMEKVVPLVTSSWVFGLIATAMLMIAGGLSYLRHTRQPRRRDSSQASLPELVGRLFRGRAGR
jgi:hypothetical protein